MSDTFRIGLRNCAFFARHGVFEAEMQLGQRFFVDVDMDVTSGAGLINDDLVGTVDYGAAFSTVEKIVTKGRFKLIEALAYHIGKGLCDQFEIIEHVSVTIRKPGAPIPGIFDHAEVCVDFTPER